MTPEESRAYYDDFFARGKADGMASFEPDFMNQNYNCVPDFIESATAATVWQHGMTDAALAQNLTVQWCYAAPTDVLASLEMPALTNFRVSNDFCYGSSWNVGVSSLIVWAVGSAPSKDTLYVCVLLWCLLVLFVCCISNSFASPGLFPCVRVCC